MRAWLKRWGAAVATVVVAMLLVAPIAYPQGWGWTPGTAPPTVPPAAVAVRFGTALQPVVDALPATGGILQLDPGRFYADASDSTLQLTLNKPVTIIGQSMSGTIIASPILIVNGDCHLEAMRVRPTGAAYGIKLFRDQNVYTYGAGLPGGGVPRCSFRNMYVGGDSIGDPATPAIGVYLDGAILATVDHVTVAYCSGDGLYENSSQLPSWSTNQNLYLNCTFNGNGGFGVHLVGGGITGTTFIGGNMENNVSGEISASSCINGIIEGVDFERATGVTNVINLSSCTSWRITSCNFNMNHSVTRILLASTCNNIFMSHNRANGLNTASQVGVFDEASSNCREWNNVFADSLDYIQNRAFQDSHNLWGAQWQPQLSQFTGLLWLPSSSGSGVVGNWNINDPGTVGNDTPSSSDLSTQLRRNKWTRTADNQNMGPTDFSGADCAFSRGDKQFAGGFYFSATFRLDTWGSNAGGGNSTRLFVGMASNGSGLMTAQVDSSTLSGEFIGLYHDGQDKNIFRLVYSDGSTVSKVALNALGGAANMQVASGEAYKFEIWYPPKGGTFYCKLTSINRHAVCGFQQTTGGPLTTTMLGPQVLMGTGTGGACVFAVANVYVTQ